MRLHRSVLVELGKVGLVAEQIFSNMSEQQSEQQLRAELDAVYCSASWKLTAPLRMLNATLRRVLPAVSPTVSHDLSSDIKQEDASAVMNESVDANATSLQAENDLPASAELDYLPLSPSAQHIFAELNTLIEKQIYAHRS